MKYRAVVVGITEPDGRPIQNFSSSLQAMRTWAKEMGTAKNAYVSIKELVEKDCEQWGPDGNLVQQF